MGKRNVPDRLARIFLAKATLLTDRAVQLSVAKACAFSDSVLCMGRISENQVSAWKEKNDWFITSTSTVGSRVDGEPMEFEIQIMMTETHCRPKQFPGRIIFISM